MGDLLAGDIFLSVRDQPDGLLYDLVFSGDHFGIRLIAAFVLQQIGELGGDIDSRGFKAPPVIVPRAPVPGTPITGAAVSEVGAKLFPSSACIDSGFSTEARAICATSCVVPFENDATTSPFGRRSPIRSVPRRTRRPEWFRR